MLSRTLGYVARSSRNYSSSKIFPRDIKSFRPNVWAERGSISTSHRDTKRVQNGDKNTRASDGLVAKRESGGWKGGGGRRPGLGICFGGGESLRCFFQNVRLKTASKSPITVLINHRASVLAQIDARVVITVQTSQQQQQQRILTTASMLSCCKSQCKIQNIKWSAVLLEKNKTNESFPAQERCVPSGNTRFDRTRWSL